MTDIHPDSHPSTTCTPPPASILPLCRSPWQRVAAGFFVLAIVGSVVVWHLRSGLRLAAQQAHAAATIVLYEQAQRSGRLAPENVGMATFGYLGWLFQNYYAAHEGQTAPLIGGFTRYAQHWGAGRGTGILTTLPKSLHHWRDLIPTRNIAALRDTPGVPMLGEITLPLFGQGIRYTLLHGPSEARVPGSLSLDPASYQRVPFPLNDSEWQQLILDSNPLP